MRCSHCHRPVPLGGTPPGVFFLLALVAAVSAAVTAALGLWLYLAPSVLVLLIAAGGTVANMGDRRSMGAAGRALDGRRCQGCGTVSPIRPWSV